jgi:hypothetical protein
MEDFPKLGMTHTQVRDRLMKYDKPKAKALKDSMLRQVKLAEGEGAMKDIDNEVSARLTPIRSNCNTNFITLKTMRTTGIGNGKVLICPMCGHKPLRSDYVDDKWICSEHKCEVIDEG